MEEPLQVNKGGVCWLEIGAGRGKLGVKLYVKTDPRVEDFIKSLGTGKKDGVEVYGRSWTPVSPNKALEIYQYSNGLQSESYTLDAPAETFRAPRCGRVNLSFLRIVGIGEPEGVSFGIVGPYSRPFIREALRDVTKEVRSLVRDYIVPFDINIRISSQEA